MSNIFLFKQVQICEHNDSFTTSSISYDLKIGSKRYRNQICQVKQNEGADMDLLDALEVNFEGTYPEGFQYNSAQRIVTEYYHDFFEEKLSKKENYPQTGTTIKYKKKIKER